MGGRNELKDAKGAMNALTYDEPAEAKKATLKKIVTINVFNKTAA